MLKTCKVLFIWYYDYHIHWGFMAKYITVSCLFEDMHLIKCYKKINFNWTLKQLFVIHIYCNGLYIFYLISSGFCEMWVSIQLAKYMSLTILARPIWTKFLKTCINCYFYEFSAMLTFCEVRVIFKGPHCVGLIIWQIYRCFFSWHKMKGNLSIRTNLQKKWWKLNHNCTKLDCF